jgi:hypothetical protein
MMGSDGDELDELDEPRKTMAYSPRRGVFPISSSSSSLWWGVSPQICGENAVMNLMN